MYFILIFNNTSSKTISTPTATWNFKSDFINGKLTTVGLMIEKFIMF